jgi:hypothetical protein
LYLTLRRVRLCDPSTVSNIRHASAGRS